MRQRDKSWNFILLYLAGLVIVVVLACFMCGCTTTRYVPVESVREVLRTDTVYEAVWRADSVVERDSVLTFVKGDTVLVEKVKWRMRVRERKDTVHETRTDSVFVRKPYPVERKLTRWEKSKMNFGGMAIGVCGAVLLLLTIGVVCKLRRKT